MANTPNAPNAPNAPNNPFLLSDKLYLFVKRLVQVILPAFSAAYFGLAGIWGLPHAKEVVGTIAVVTTFLGVVLGISSAQYSASDAAYDGHMVVSQQPGEPKKISLELNGDPHELENKTSVAFKVKKGPPSPD